MNNLPKSRLKTALSVKPENKYVFGRLFLLRIVQFCAAILYCIVYFTRRRNYDKRRISENEARARSVSGNWLSIFF